MAAVDDWDGEENSCPFEVSSQGGMSLPGMLHTEWISAAEIEFSINSI